MRDAGKQLDADYILEGTVLRSGQQVRINAQLVRVRDDFPLWSGKYERELTDILAIQDEISRGIANSLRLKLGRGRRRYETSAEAYDLYLHARALRTGRAPGDREVIGLFEKAIARDPSLAPAYAGLATAYAVRSFTMPDDPGRADQLARMRVVADKAIQLDPLLAEAHSTLGTAYGSEAHWSQAETSFRRALEIDPNLSIAHEKYAWFVLMPLARFEEAVREARAEVRIDPLSPAAHYLLGWTLTLAGRYDDAVAECQKLPADFFGTCQCLGRARLGQARTDEAIRVLANESNWGYLAYAYARAGQPAKAERLMANATPLDRPQGALPYALAYAGLKDKNRTADALERFAAVGPVRMGFHLNSPEFAFLRGDRG